MKETIVLKITMSEDKTSAVKPTTTKISGVPIPAFIQVLVQPTSSLYLRSWWQDG